MSDLIEIQKINEVLGSITGQNFNGKMSLM